MLQNIRFKKLRNFTLFFYFISFGIVILLNLFLALLQLVILYVDFKLDESYTPSKVSIRAGDGFHNLKVISEGQSLGAFLQMCNSSHGCCIFFIEK